ncbi:hypothetical protein JW978_01880 [Candidatus Dojkabacteria bacterium]|nr:hypothetical protein [Candidatus Dojkabacteria bacterium]
MKYTSQIKGTGLVEVLVALAIFSLTMITVVSVTTTSLKRIKRDEVEDRAIGIQFRSLELAKSPVQNLGLEKMKNGDIEYYTLEVAANKIELKKVNGSTVISPGNCSTQSNYYVNLADYGYEDVGDNLICNQVTVEFLGTQDDLDTYEVKSLLVYNSAGKLEFNELVGYRREKSI